MKTNQSQKNIPSGWQQVKLGDIGVLVIDGDRGKNYPKNNDLTENNYCLFLSASNVTKRGFAFENNQFISKEKDNSMGKGKLNVGDIVITTRGTIGNTAFYSENIFYKYVRINSGMAIVRNIKEKTGLETRFLNKYFQSSSFIKEIDRLAFGSAQPQLTIPLIKNLKIDLPLLPEQNRIVSVLETWDKAIEKLSKKIEVKKQIKKGLMQDLLTSKKRLKGFSEKWETVKLSDIAVNLDNKRVPLNFDSRDQRKGEIPYCGANGIVGYIDDYIFDEDVILIAEDGGQFDEYKTRPIAYRMTGKCWVNNHAHVIKAKEGFSQDLLFYLTVHKDILAYLNGGTRAKLNKSELQKLKYFIPSDKEEQRAIAKILTIADNEIKELEKKLQIIKDQKKYLLNNLITGTIRTPETLSAKLIK
jgi:type I restriction enzyme S subunit